MYLKQIKYLSAVIFFALLFFSCESLDDIKPFYQLTEENVVNNKKSANALLNRCYNSMRDDYTAYLGSAMGFYGIEEDIVNGLQYAGINYKNNDVQDNNELLKLFYKQMYFTINNSNFLIEQLEQGKAIDMTDAEVKEMISEAKTIRAISHFYLLRVFGQFYDMNSQFGVVATTTPIRGKVELPRNSVNETYNAILADLQYASDNGPTGKQSVYLNKSASQAFLAKVQLYVGDYTNAASNASAVINNTTDSFNLVPNYDQIFQLRWTSSEVLFAPFVDGANETDTSSGNYFSSNVAAPSNYFKALADDSDGASNDGSTDNTTGYDPRYVYAYSAATSGPYTNGKYPFLSYVEGNTYYFMRMAEVYLIYAEAETRKTGGDLTNALAKVNEIRTRAGVPSKVFVDKATLLKDIRNEKMLELFTETGESWYDLIRYGELGDLTISSFKSSLNNKNKYILPIPIDALAGNSSLVQNPK